MTQTMTGTPAAAAGSTSLAARVLGVLFSPRATYAQVAARPRWLGVFLTVFLVSSAAATAFLATEVGRVAVVDQQIAQSESYGRHMNQAQLDAIEKMSGMYVYFAPVFQLAGLGFGSLIVAAIAFAVFSALLGGDATFKQVFAVVVHSSVVLSALALFTTPLAYVRESVSSATNLAVFLPFLDESSFAARLLTSIDLIYVWWMISLAIGLGVLYRKRTAPIATSLLVIYASIGLIIASIKTVMSGV
jgi:Yip1 domain